MARQDGSGDAIPRLHKIVEHPADQLAGMATGEDSFEACRVRYGATVARLSDEGRGRQTASRVPASEQYWGSTRDLLRELMRWDAVQTAPLPSSRKVLDEHRARRYPLTDKGQAMAATAAAGRAGFTDAVADELISAHPAFRALLEALADGPIVCASVSEGDVRDGRGGPAGWARWAAELAGGGAAPERFEAIIRERLRQRFSGRPADDPPTRKAVAETLNDAFSVAAFDARGLVSDGPTINTLRAWGRELLLFDQSRYVPAVPSANVVWSACDLSEGPGGQLQARRRGAAAFGAQLAQALAGAYRDAEQAQSAGFTVPIHPMRAQAAFEIGVTRALADRVLADIVDGDYPELGIHARVFLGGITFPDSEKPAFRHRGRVRLEIQMAPHGAATERSPA